MATAQYRAELLQTAFGFLAARKLLQNVDNSEDIYLPPAYRWYDDRINPDIPIPLIQRCYVAARVHG